MSNPPSATERLAQVEHVQYELTQMVGAAIRVAGTTDPITKNALLESALLHARSLIDFLTDSGRPQDIRASTFGSTWRIDTVTHNALRDRKKLLDQHLAHITEARAQDGKQQWPYLKVVSEIVDLMRRYHAGLPAGSPAESSIGATLQRISQQVPLPPLPSPGGTMSTPLSTTTSTAIISTTTSTAAPHATTTPAAKGIIRTVIDRLRPSRPT